MILWYFVRVDAVSRVVESWLLLFVVDVYGGGVGWAVVMLGWTLAFDGDGSVL